MLNAIITGDIIHSTKMSNDERVNLLNRVNDSLKIWNKEFEMKSEIFRGDSFQCLLSNPADALTVALLLKTFIRSTIIIKKEKGYLGNTIDNIEDVSYVSSVFDARIAIGIGEIDADNGTLGMSGGIAFNLSGYLLDKIKNKKQALAIATNDSFND
ncbi:MAG: hypothetical protein HY305_00465, partial [Sphingobacteriales bacterium]|nr:hypothetical protein [Sphingobacteriales bacterium]